MSFRFLHLADLHLDTRFGGREATRARLREATLEAWFAAVELARSEELDAVLIAGDCFDDPLLSRRAELAFVRGLRQLAEDDVHVVIACGNHDPGGGSKRMSSMGLEEKGDWRDRVHLLRTARPKKVVIPGRRGDGGVVVGAGHATDREEKNLAASFTPLATELPVVGLLHTQVHAARTSTEHAAYAPSSREDLEHLGYDYFALGHVHLRQRPFEEVPAWYSGNLQGRNPKERGEKGGLLVELHPGEVATPRFVSLAPVIWDRVRVEDLGACTTAQDVLAHLNKVVSERVSAAASKELCLVVELSGTTRAARVLSSDEDRVAFEEDLIESTGALEVQLRPEGLRPLRNLDELRATPSVISSALELCVQAQEDPAVLELIAPEHLAGPAEDTGAYLSSLLEGLEHELLERCLEDDA